VNILTSYNWLKEYVAFKGSADVFARQVSLCGPSVERQYPQAQLYDHLVIGQILAVEPHPNADKLRIVKTDIGKRKIDLVCGGSNLSVGMKVVVALAGASVRWHGQGEPVILAPTEIRGVKSEGMICAASEIGLGDAFPHAEKEILDLSWCKAKPGTAFAKALGLDDTVFDIEVTTNRPDAFSVVGLAREAAAILGLKFVWKEPVVPSVSKTAKHRELEVKNLAPKLCTRYEAVVVDNICLGPSPWWLKNRLRLSGLRPINNIVDITNYVMLEYGQPLHAFDYERIAGQTIVVRAAKAGEKLKILDGREVELRAEDLVIADAEKPMAVAGVIGGEASSVTAETKTIVFESACFDPVAVRRTARGLNAHTDASLRYEKGLPDEQTNASLARAVELCQEIACGRVASHVIDERVAQHKKVKHVFRPAKAEQLIGVKIPKHRMLAILRSLGFGISPRSGRADKAKYEVTVPYWRERDIEGERDFAEEIARIHGYHNLPSVLPTGEIPLEPPSPILRAEDDIREFLRGAGFTELVTYSFVSAEVLEKCGFNVASCQKIANPLSQDFEYMRPSLLPGLLMAVKANQGAYPSGRLFEVSNVYPARAGQLPDEHPMFQAAYYAHGLPPEEQFRLIKGVFESYAKLAGLLDIRLERVAADERLWHPGRSARIMAGETALGTLGEIHPAVLQKFGVDGAVMVFELDLRSALAAAKPGKRYIPVSPFPPVRRDMAIVVNERVEYGEVAATVRSASPLVADMELFDVYRGENLGAGKKSLAFHLTLASADRTLTAEDADKTVAGIVQILTERFGAALRV
jgi:phenylalanyl-tRNA synthetase beta chain